MAKIMKLLLFLVFVNFYIHFRMWTWIRNPRVMDPDPTKSFRILADPGPHHWFRFQLYDFFLYFDTREPTSVKLISGQKAIYKIESYKQFLTVMFTYILTILTNYAK
jgi:hypothetical protein